MTTDTKTGMTRRGLSRRALLKATAGTAALIGAVQTNFPFGVYVAEAAGPEVTKANLGFIALTDAAPLFVAKEKGIFAKYGMPDVEVQKQASWGATRDNLVLGSEGNGIDGAHILTPMPYLISAGKVTQNNVPTPMYIVARLNLDSQCISVAKEYADLKIYLPNDPLVKVDRMSMANSLEIRCPLLDHRVVERAFAIPRREKLRRLEPKAVLRRIARERLPKELLEVPKHGFTAPVGEWLAGEHADAYCDEVLRPGSAVSSWLDM